jgi:hypothetical protein
MERDFPIPVVSEKLKLEAYAATEVTIRWDQHHESVSRCDGNISLREEIPHVGLDFHVPRENTGE